MKKPKTTNAKPLWAQTQKQVEQNEEAEVDDVIDFFETAELKDYLQDNEVNKILEDLKGRIEKLKGQGDDWKKKEVNRIKEGR